MKMLPPSIGSVTFVFGRARPPKPFSDNRGRHVRKLGQQHADRRLERAHRRHMLPADLRAVLHGQHSPPVEE